jgi:UDP-N-acetylmuramoyl-tripeptide--D-alanyl-D-alanine ligase
LHTQKASILPIDAQHPFLRLQLPGYPLVETQLIGAYNADNVLAALAVGAYFDVDPLQAVEAVRGYKPSNNRSQRMQTAKNVLIVDAYNANPTSMAAALDNFEQLPAAHKIVILGDMLELGADSEQEHRTLVKRLIDLQKIGAIEEIVLVGPRLEAAAQKYPLCICSSEVSALRTYLLKHPITAATVLIKGSRGMRLEQAIELL